MLIDDKKKRQKLLFILGSIALISAPLFFVRPVGPRCFFLTFILFILFTHSIFVELSMPKAYSRNINFIIKSSTLGYAIFLAVIYIQIGLANHNRINSIYEQLESNPKKITITHLPHEEYLWKSTPLNKKWKGKFKLFYGINEEIKIKIVKSD